jgi:hypothetical protein
MPKYNVVGYWSQSVNLEVEAENADEAMEIGYDRIRFGGEGIEGDGEWQDEFSVWEKD